MPDLQSIQKRFKDFFSKLSKKNKLDQTLQDYMELAANHPEDMRLRLKIAETYFKLRNIPKAIEVYREIADHYEAENFILKAINIYKNILTLDPLLLEINLKLAELYLKLEMNADAVNQYHIAANLYGSKGEKEKVLDLWKKIVDIEPLAAHRRKLAEIYHAHGATKEAIAEYEKLAQEFRLAKDYDSLLRIYEFLLPYKQGNQTLIKDICILYLRKSQPDQAIRIMERYKVDAEPAFSNLYEKAKLMKKALRGPAS